MPALSVRFIRISLLYLLIGFGLGAVLLFHKGVPIDSSLWSLLDVHVEVVLIGWILHLAMGTAYWMFPRFNPKKTNMKQRGYETAAWVSLICLNAGILVFCLGKLAGYLIWAPFIGRSLEAVGVVAFVFNLWPRTKPVGG